MDVPVTGQVSMGLLPDQMPRSLAAAHSLVKTQMSGLSLPSGPSPSRPASRTAGASRLDARLSCLRLSQSGAVQTRCGCRPHTEPLSVGQGKAASRAEPEEHHSQQPLPRSVPGKQRLPVWGPPCAPQGCTSPWKVCPRQAGALRGTSAPLEPSPVSSWTLGDFRFQDLFLVPVFYFGAVLGLGRCTPAFLWLPCPSFSLRCLLLPRSSASVVGVRRLCCCVACGIFPDRGSDRRLLHRKVGS